MLVCVRDETISGQSLYELSLEFLSERVTVPLDWEAQFALAVEGFATNAYFVIIDDRQAETLDETFVVGPQTKVSFIKLTPLVGG